MCLCCTYVHFTVDPRRLLASAFSKLPEAFPAVEPIRSMPRHAGLQPYHLENPIANQSCINHRSASMLKSLEEHRPWTQATGATPEQLRDPPENPKYIAWQIRTSDGESATSYKPDVHTHVFDHVPSTEVCPWFFTAMEEALGSCRDESERDAMPIFVSSNRSVVSIGTVATSMVFVVSATGILNSREICV